MQEEHSTSAKEPGFWFDLWEIVWLPAVLALLAMSATWAVWYFTAEPSDPKSVRPTECDWDKLEKCFSLNLVNKMFTHGAIAGGTGGVSLYIMLRRERLAREAAERRAETERQAREAAERRFDEERQRYIDRILELTRTPDGSQEQASSE